MLRYLKALFYMCTGRLEKARKALMENEHVMAATYDAAIAKTQNSFQTTRAAVAEMVSIEQAKMVQLKGLGEKTERLMLVKNGAQIAMQKRIDVLRSQGKSKDDIVKDAEFIKHQAAYNDASSTLAEVESSYTSVEKEVNERRAMLATYKAQLQKMQRADETLKTEKEEALADVAIARQSEAVDAQLAGLSLASIDKDLKDAREARNRAKARASVTSELAGNDAKIAEDEYVKFSSQTATANQLDGLLNWGDEKTEAKEDLQPAKLPE